MTKYAFKIVIGIIIGIVVILLILAEITEKFFPDNKISKLFERIVEWINNNIRI